MLQKEIETRLEFVVDSLKLSENVQGASVINDMEDENGNHIPNTLEVIVDSNLDPNSRLVLVLELNKSDIVVIDAQYEIDYEDEGPDDIKYMDIYYCKAV